MVLYFFVWFFFGVPVIFLMLSLSFLFIWDVILLAVFISFGGHVGVDFGVILGSCWGLGKGSLSSSQKCAKSARLKRPS